MQPSSLQLLVFPKGGSHLDHLSAWIPVLCWLGEGGKLALELHKHVGWKGLLEVIGLASRIHGHLVIYLNLENLDGWCFPSLFCWRQQGPHRAGVLLPAWRWGYLVGGSGSVIP